MRQPKQVLVVPYAIYESKLYFYLLKRKDIDYWKWIAGGVEENETLLRAAIRESTEELDIMFKTSDFIPLESVCSIPRCHFSSDKAWGDDFYMVTKYSFAARLSMNCKLNLSDEHSEVNIIKYSDLSKYHSWDSNRTAAWELNERFLQGTL